MNETEKRQHRIGILAQISLYLNSLPASELAAQPESTSKQSSAIPEPYLGDDLRRDVYYLLHRLSRENLPDLMKQIESAQGFENPKIPAVKQDTSTEFYLEKEDPQDPYQTALENFRRKFDSPEAIRARRDCEQIRSSLPKHPEEEDKRSLYTTTISGIRNWSRILANTFPPEMRDTEKAEIWDHLLSLDDSTWFQKFENRWRLIEKLQLDLGKLITTPLFEFQKASEAFASEAKVIERAEKDYFETFRPIAQNTKSNSRLFLLACHDSLTEFINVRRGLIQDKPKSGDGSPAIKPETPLRQNLAADLYEPPLYPLSLLLEVANHLSERLPQAHAHFGKLKDVKNAAIALGLDGLPPDRKAARWERLF